MPLSTLVWIVAIVGQVFVAPTGQPLSTSGFTGSWRLELESAATASDFAGYSVASRIVINESDNVVSIQSNAATEGQMQAAIYRLDGAETVVPGPIGWDTRATAARNSSQLIIHVRRSIEGPDGKVEFDIRDVYTVVGITMTLERSQGTRTQKWTYTRLP